MPYQAEGHYADGRAFYFRSRWGRWTLEISPAPEHRDYLDWGSAQTYNYPQAYGWCDEQFKEWSNAEIDVILRDALLGPQDGRDWHRGEQ